MGSPIADRPSASPTACQQTIATRGARQVQVDRASTCATSQQASIVTPKCTAKAMAAALPARCLVGAPDPAGVRVLDPVGQPRLGPECRAEPVRLGPGHRPGEADE